MPRRGGGSGGLALGEARGNPVGPPPTAVRDREWTSLARARRARGFFSLSFLRAKGKPARRPRGRDFRRASLNHNSKRRGNPRQPLYNHYSTHVGASRGYPPRRRRARRGGGVSERLCPSNQKTTCRICVVAPTHGIFSFPSRRVGESGPFYDSTTSQP